mmetsp:Transcript_2668/g.6996  ORF Transcript_2668/g.6996 Transcript_2668/m.6996 type:complete len:105 (+) Transcript_2668:681-995(+)
MSLLLSSAQERTTQRMIFSSCLSCVAKCTRDERQRRCFLCGCGHVNSPPCSLALYPTGSVKSTAWNANSLRNSKRTQRRPCRQKRNLMRSHGKGAELAIVSPAW